MARRSKTDSEASNADARTARGRKSVKAKSRIASAAKPGKPSLVADLEARLELRTQEAEEFRQQHIHDLLSSEGDQVPEAQQRAKVGCHSDLPSRILRGPLMSGGFSHFVTSRLLRFLPVGAVAGWDLHARERAASFRTACHPMAQSRQPPV
jgi:hypothetical protein